MTAKYTQRTSIEITMAVWKALFLREATTRLSSGRFAWLWLVLNPLSHVVLMMLLYDVVRARVMAGVDAGLFIGVGVMGFFMFKSCALRSVGAISSNNALFAYRQVLPIDSVLMRCLLEGMIEIIVAVILVLGAAFIGMDALPCNPFEVVIAFFLLWIFGTGMGLMLSACAELIPEIGHIADIIFFPLYMASGVMFSLTVIPPMYREYVLLNPIVHGIEYLRYGFFKGYHLMPTVDISYLALWAVTSLFFGLALHVRFARRLTDV